MYFQNIQTMWLEQRYQMTILYFIQIRGKHWYGSLCNIPYVLQLNLYILDALTNVMQKKKKNGPQLYPM